MLANKCSWMEWMGLPVDMLGIMRPIRRCQQDLGRFLFVKKYHRRHDSVGLKWPMRPYVKVQSLHCPLDLIVLMRWWSLMLNSKHLETIQTLYPLLWSRYRLSNLGSFPTCLNKSTQLAESKALVTQIHWTNPSAHRFRNANEKRKCWLARRN